MPDIPIAYCQECMTGFEYAFAGLLISEGFVEEGLTIIRAVRDRYDGKKRNPYNEIECGSNYARPMAAFALLPIFSGFEYDMTKGHIGFAPIVKGDFKCLWSVGGSWGEISRCGGEMTLTVKGGEIVLCSFGLDRDQAVSSVTIDGKATEYMKKGRVITFEKTGINKSLRVVF